MVSVTPLSSQDIGDGQTVVADVGLDNSYSQKGELVTAADFRFRVGSRLDLVRANPVGGRSLEFVPDPTLADRGRLRVLGELGDDFLLNRPALQIGTGDAAEVRNGNPFTKVVGGAIAEVAIGETAFTATTHDITADALLIQEAVFLVSVQAGGTRIVTKGATAGEGLAVPPALPAGEALVGYATVQVAAGAVDFDATTDDLDAAHLTTTFQDGDGEALQAADLSALTFRVEASGR